MGSICGRYFHPKFSPISSQSGLITNIHVYCQWQFWLSLLNPIALGLYNLSASVNDYFKFPSILPMKCRTILYQNVEWSQCPVVAPGPTVAIILSICNCKKAGELGRAGTNVLALILALWSSRPLSVRWWCLYRTWLLSSLTHDQTHRTDEHANGRSSLVKSTILSVQEQYTHVKYTCT